MEPSRTRTDGARRRLRAVPREDTTAALSEVRRIVLGAEQARLDALESQQPFVSSERVGSVLPEAIGEARRDRDDDLSIALEPALTRSLRGVIQRDSETIGEILAPTIGAAVRSAVARALAEMMQRIDVVLARSISPESVLWRIEAWRTGRPVAEVALAHTLLFRVEQVFLIHSPSGIALRHLCAPGVCVADPDQVASMLAAIDAFVVDAFATGEPEAHVAQFEAGALTVWVDRDPLVTVALVSRGAAQREIATLVHDARQRIALEQREELDSFVSDVAPFVRAEPALQACLVDQRTPPPRRAPLVLGVGAALLIAGIVAGVVAWRSARDGRERVLARSVAVLEAEPGIVVTDATRRDGRIHIAGLRDPLAAAPARVLAAQGLDAAHGFDAALDFEPFESRDPELAAARARDALAPPPTVRASLDRGTLTLAGEAPQEWIDRARIVSSLLPGVARLDERSLRVSGPDAEAALTALVVPFRPESAVPAAGAIDTATAHARAVLARGEACIDIDAHAAERGAGGGARALRERRAEAVARALRDRGIDASRVAVSEISRRARIATFRVRPGSCEESP